MGIPVDLFSMLVGMVLCAGIYWLAQHQQGEGEN